MTNRSRGLPARHMPKGLLSWTFCFKCEPVHAYRPSEKRNTGAIPPNGSGPRQINAPHRFRHPYARLWKTCIWRCTNGRKVYIPPSHGSLPGLPGYACM